MVDALVAAAAGAALLAGLARPGFPLLRDMVATPAPAATDAALGLGGAAARAVPQDLAMVTLTRAASAVGLPTWPVLGLLAFAFCVWLGVGAGALVRRALPCVGLAARLPAVVVAVWNPYVVERLLQGHWSLLAGLAAVTTLPVLLLGAAAGASRAPRVRRLAGIAACVAAAGLTPSGWLLATVTASVCLAVRAVSGRRSRASGDGGARGVGAEVVVVACSALVTAAPWAVATALGGAGTAGATGVEPFAARAEPGIGTAGALAALGGIWNGQAVPDSRTTWWASAALLLLAGVWALAAPVLRRARRSPLVRTVVPLGLAAWLLVTLAATPPGLAALDALVRALPAAGLLRDAQKWVAPLVPATVLAVAAAGGALARRGTGDDETDRAVLGGAARPVLASPSRSALAALACLVVVVAQVPDAPGVLWRALTPTRYGPGWEGVDRITAPESGGPAGAVLVLPGGMVRSTPLWAGGRPVLDPAPRLLRAPVPVTGGLAVGSSSGAADLGGEDARAAGLERLVLSGADPRALVDGGVRWVLDERTSAGPRGDSARTLAHARLAYRDDELTLWELPGGEDAAYPRASEGRRAAVIAAHVPWALLLAGSLVLVVGVRRRGDPSDRVGDDPALAGGA